MKCVVTIYSAGNVTRALELTHAFEWAKQPERRVGEILHLNADCFFVLKDGTKIPDGWDVVGDIRFIEKDAINGK